MIKPTSLWNFIHECDTEDAEYIGRICLALAGKQVTFSRAEKIQYLTISKDNNDMDERIKERKERDRERKWKWRNAERRGGTRTDADGADSPSPSIHPLQEEEDAATRVRARRGGNPPTMERVLAFAADAVHHPGGKTYPKEWAMDWMAVMEASDPPWTKGGHRIVDWQRKMINDWLLHEKELERDRTRGGRMPDGMVYQQEGYDVGRLGV